MEFSLILGNFDSYLLIKWDKFRSIRKAGDAKGKDPKHKERREKNKEE